jgi:GNAT superfamily N-acetyltransferase
MTTYHLREATVADAATIAEFRRVMFEGMGLIRPGEGAAMVAAMRRYVHRELPSGGIVAWIVEADGLSVAAGVLSIVKTSPAPGFEDDEVAGHIHNIWTEPEHRRRGLAGQIVEAMLAWCRKHGVHRLTLNATDDGRGIYTAFGFRPSTAGMALTLDPDTPA